MRLDGRNAAPTEMNQATDESTMRAILQDRYGSAEVLRPARIGRPVIADRSSPTTRCWSGCTLPVLIGGPGT